MRHSISYRPLRAIDYWRAISLMSSSNGKPDVHLELYKVILIADEAYNRFNLNIRPARPWRHENRRLTNQIASAFHAFFARARHHGGFDTDTQLLYMDAMQDFMHNAFVMHRLAIRQTFAFISDPDDLDLCTEIALCNHLLDVCCVFIEDIARLSPEHSILHIKHLLRSLGTNIAAAYPGATNPISHTALENLTASIRQVTRRFEQWKPNP